MFKGYLRILRPIDFGDKSEKVASDISETILIKCRTPKHAGESYRRNI